MSVDAFVGMYTEMPIGVSASVQHPRKKITLKPASEKVGSYLDWLHTSCVTLSKA